MLLQLARQLLTGLYGFDKCVKARLARSTPLDRINKSTRQIVLISLDEASSHSFRALFKVFIGHLRGRDYD